jgi:hypothetical protein
MDVIVFSLDQEESAHLDIKILNGGSITLLHAILIPCNNKAAIGEDSP